ncbi:pyrroline-5-carboxylate reductase [Niallia circulans]|uniref:pyrroline-5-carboxylate reductase n=1 Tax=Niallia circulans TaxID=1397 RepID=UPI0026F31692|nr:pyrroline-5-carboxylate reductase [Niallia circulans]
MEKRKVGFIGCGKMAQAMVNGMLQSSFLSREDILASTKSVESAQMVRETFHIETTLDNKKVASFADVLIVAVKPHLYGEVLQEILSYVKNETIIVTVAAGIEMAYIESQLSKNAKVIRSMPNTPSLVGEGMTVFCANERVTEPEIAFIKEMFAAFGQVEVMEENLMDYIPAISGSSPAYVYMFIEALADGGVRSGIPREKAYKLAAQSVLGAAKMVLETGKHPGILKDEVCTPGGATIEAITALEQNQFRGTILAAMESCDCKNRRMKKEN